MTYFGFLLQYIIVPILILGAIAWWDGRRGRKFPESLSAWPASFVLLALVLIALVYTTPWDNYLVATKVWWYDPALVIGWVIGWVPIEEYSFFVLQTILTSLWIWFLARRLPVRKPQTAIRNSQLAQSIRWISFTLCTLLWLVSLYLWLSHWQNIQYLAITLSWALLPVLLQLGFGGDILWQHRTLLFWSLLPPTVYLCLVDALAISAGTWTIAPDQSTNILVGTLPLEEAVFFFVTNLLIVLGTILVLAKESQARAPSGILEVMRRIIDKTNSLKIYLL